MSRGNRNCWLTAGVAMPEITESDVYEFLSQHAGRGVTDVSRLIQQGAWSTAFSYRDRRSERIVRFSRFDEDFRKDKFAARFASSRLPVPQVIDIGEALGGYYATSVKAKGGPIDSLSQEEMQRILPQLLDLLDAIHLADVSETTGYGTWASDGNARHATWRESLLDIAHDRPRERFSGWKRKLAASPIGIEFFCRAYRQLVTLADFCPEERHLVHADLLHFNLLVDNSRISALIDWGSAKYGDFLYDLAWLTFWAPWLPSMSGIDFRLEALRRYSTCGVDVSHFEERMRCYEVHIGLDSLVYSSFRENWEFAREVSEHMLDLLEAS